MTTPRTLTIIRDDKCCSSECRWLWASTCLLFRDNGEPQHLFKNGDSHTPCPDCDYAMENLADFRARRQAQQDVLEDNLAVFI
jgi:hypothetical protein